MDENQCLQDERVDCSSGCMRAFVWDFEGSRSSQWSSPIIKRGLELMDGTFGSTFGKEEVGVRFPLLVSSLSQFLLMKD